ncbi:hypothetical protein PLESTB_001205700 [Pleodorina starrii]|uniref:UGP3-like C-terminal hexapeptide repeats domain-containing protein n=1 Tax=Pleodorina starrii TaxID=330485 RepID=A0A9W6BRR3_9CHLO|nr:hypothetical protein PLESTM_001749000 [Pleodorina starrii]GLC57266.1 hypothetical protein PLESTB_001205700 [Pleodorina starrii]GLC71342.1 hypothetical protein PLESTF_001105100 [Pleodorina starrii]
MATRAPSAMPAVSASSQPRGAAAPLLPLLLPLPPHQPAPTPAPAAWARRILVAPRLGYSHPTATRRSSVVRSAASGHAPNHPHPRHPQPRKPTTAPAAQSPSAATARNPPATPVPPEQQDHHQQQRTQLPYFAPLPGTGTVQSYEDEFQLQSDAELPLEAQIVRLEAILEHVRVAETDEDKVVLLGQVDSVAAFVNNPRNAAVCGALSSLDASHRALLLSLPAMMQEHVLMEPPGAPPSPPEALLPRLTSLAVRLARVEQFYDSVGGLLGYQIKSLQLIVAGMQDKSARSKQQQQQQQQQTEEAAAANADAPPGPAPAPGPGGGVGEVRFHVPRGMDLAGEEGAGVGVAAAAQGLAALPFMAEIYPVGGAGDRLGLVDEATGESLPAAMLPYAGRTLMEVLIRDLQAREYLHFQLTGRQVTTPVAIMTSDAKGNHDRVSRLLGELQWAGRGPGAFRLFRQPMVPVLAAEDGRWLLSRPMGPMMKPGGHGAIWKLMWDQGVFDWLTVTHGRRAALVRQISNPMAGTDTTLLALAGAGFARGRGGGAAAFGFMSCERAVGAAEGMNVLQERRRWVPAAAAAGSAGGGGGGRWVYEYGVTNVEYTEFERLGLSDEAVSANSKTSVFPANTNVLFVGLYGAKRIVAEAVSKGDGEQLLPGLIFNLNKKVSYTDPLGGGTREVTGGRMESTMQNLADYLTDSFDRPMDPRELPESKLSTFLVSNLRRKVTSSAKKRRQPGSPRIAQTPDGSFYDLQRNAWQLLQRCGLADVPEPGSTEQYLEKGPGFIFLFHPALGPLWDVISQKVVGGSLTHGSELVLEVAEARLQQLHLDGSLQICAENVMGHTETVGLPPVAAASAAASAAAQAHHHHHHYQAAAGAATSAAPTLSISSLHNGTVEMALGPRGVAHGGPVQQQQQAAAAGGGGGAGGGDAVGGGVSPAPGGGGLLRYGRRCGRVQLVNVRVVNAGVDWQAPDNVYWKHQVSRRESCKVVLLGQSEFEAYDVTIAGSHTFVVPDGFRLTVTAAAAADGAVGGGALRTQLTPLTPAAAGTAAGGYEPSWEWVYSMDTAGAVRLSYVGAALPRAAPAAAGMAATATARAMAAAERRGTYVLDFSI